MDRLRKIRERLLQFSNFWFGIDEVMRHIILFFFPVILAAVMTAIGSLTHEIIEKHLGAHMNLFWFLTWAIVMFVMVWLFAIIMDERHKLEEQMCHDYLTGVYTRRYLYEQAINMVRRANFDRKIVCVCFVDLDNLKILNDSICHAVGDDALRLVGQTLDSVMRKKVDVVGRYGGDEFLAAWVTDSVDNINDTYMRIINALSVMSITHEGKKILVTASTGLSSGRCSPEKDPEKEFSKLVKQADAVLQSHKIHKD